eukprot:707574-Ditylum_brightwellii.AAC.2
MELVQWQALGQASENLSLHNKIWVLKFQHNWLTTAKCIHKLYPSKSALCPVCATEKETWEHMFQCKHNTACTT